jgi:hypothetical protein
MPKTTGRTLLALLALAALGGGPARADFSFDFTLAATPTLTQGYNPGTNVTTYVEKWDIANPQDFPAPAGLSGDLNITIHTPAGTELVVPFATSFSGVTVRWRQDGATSPLASSSAPFAYLGVGPPLGSGHNVAFGDSSHLTVVNMDTAFPSSSPFTTTGAALHVPGFLTALAAAAPGAMSGTPFYTGSVFFAYDVPGNHTRDPFPPIQSFLRSVPEPGSVVLMGIGGVGMAVLGYRKRKAAKVTA